MCACCNLTVPGGSDALCHACAVALRAEVRRGLAALEDYAHRWWELERRLTDEG